MADWSTLQRCAFGAQALGRSAAGWDVRRGPSGRGARALGGSSGGSRVCLSWQRVARARLHIGCTSGSRLTHRAWVSRTAERGGRQPVQGTGRSIMVPIRVRSVLVGTYCRVRGVSIRM
eukprot:scaffold8100_cov117-Isochrysis_galbana.AAC.13